MGLSLKVSPRVEEEGGTSANSVWNLLRPQVLKLEDMDHLTISDNLSTTSSHQSLLTTHLRLLLSSSQPVVSPLLPRSPLSSPSSRVSPA